MFDLGFTMIINYSMITNFQKEKAICINISVSISVSIGVGATSPVVSPQYQNPNYRSALFLTHRGREDDDPEDVHPVAGSFPSADEHVRGRSQIQGEVLDVGAVVVLDAVDELPPGGGLSLGLTHRGLGLHAVFNAGSILSRTGVQRTTTRTDADVTQKRTNKMPVCL